MRKYHKMFLPIYSKKEYSQRTFEFGFVGSSHLNQLDASACKLESGVSWDGEILAKWEIRLFKRMVE